MTLFWVGISFNVMKLSSIVHVQECPLCQHVYFYHPIVLFCPANSSLMMTPTWLWKLQFLTLSCVAQPDTTVVFMLSTVFTECNSIILSFSVLTIASGSTILLVTNHCSYPTALLCSETLGYVQPVDHIDDLDIPNDTACCHSATITPASQPSSSSAFDNGIDANLLSSHQRQLVDLLNKFLLSTFNNLR